MAATLATRLHAHFAPLHDQPTPDADLLARFALHGDSGAFAALVKRHGGMVAAVCRKRLGHAQDAEDAAQAVFLALARKADRVHGAAPVAAWLYGAAVKACREVVRRNRRKPWVPLTTDVPGDSVLSADHEAVAAVLDEVANLSDAHRAAVVLCELEGYPRGLAARRLGIAEGTLSSRLAAARRRLADRLTRRGFAPTALATLAGLAVGSPSFAFDLPSVTPIVQRITEAIVTTSIAWKLKLFAVLGATTATLGLALAGGDEPKPAAPPTPVVAKAAEPSFVFAAPTIQLDPSKFDKLRATSQDITAMSSDGKLEAIRTIQLSAAVEAIPFRVVNGVKTAASADTKLLQVITNPVSPDGRSVVVFVNDPADVEKPKSALYRTIISDEPSPKHHVVLLNPTGQSFRLSDWQDNPPTIVWSPDGGTLYLTRISSHRTVALLPPFLLKSTGYTTIKVDVATGKQRELNIVSNLKPLAVSPDGQTLLGTAMAESFFDVTKHFLALVSPSDDPLVQAKYRVISKPMADGWFDDAAFSPDGQRVIVTVNKWVALPREVMPKENGVNAIAMCKSTRCFHLLEIATGTMKQLSTQPQCFPDSATGVQWSADGSKVAFTDAKVSRVDAPVVATRIDEQFVVVCDPDGSNSVKIPVMLTHSPANHLHPNHRLIGWR